MKRYSLRQQLSLLLDMKEQLLIVRSEPKELGYLSMLAAAIVTSTVKGVITAWLPDAPSSL